MNINYDYYRIFYYVAKHRSFTQAANTLMNSQPNITRAIKNLEQALGCALFLRSSHSVQLTPEGEELLAHISPAMQQIQSGEDAILHCSTLQSGTISIGASEIALHRILLPVLEKFRQEYPGIRLHILNSNSQQAVSALKERRVDFSLLTPPIEQSGDFRQTELDTFREVSVCGNAYAHLAKEPLSLEQLASYPIISLCKGSSTHQLYSQWFQQHGLVFSPDIEAATADQILPMVRANLGISFVAEHTLGETSSNGSVLVLPLREQPPERRICLLKRKDMPLSVAAGKLEEMLLKYSPINRNDQPGGI